MAGRSDDRGDGKRPEHMTQNLSANGRCVAVGIDGRYMRVTQRRSAFVGSVAGCTVSVALLQLGGEAAAQGVFANRARFDELEQVVEAAGL